MTKQNKIRALILAALMVASVMVGTIALAGTAAADVVNRGAGDYDTATSEGEIGNNGVVFQGEDEITFVNAGGDTVNPASLERTAGASEGETLSIPVPEDQPTGSYENGAGFSVTVQEPRITNFDVLNEGGSDVSGGSVNPGETLDVVVDYNFGIAEDIDIAVEDESGLDVTGEVLESSNPSGADDGTATFTLDMDNVDAGDYTITVEGTSDLDFDQAMDETTLSVTSADEPTLTLDDEETTKGVNVNFDVEGSSEGNVHVVAIPQSDVTGSPDEVFRNVGDTLETGSADGFAYARVEIDGGTAVGSIESGELDTGDASVELYAAGVNPTDAETNLNNFEPIDEQTLTVNEGSLTIESPEGAYVPGSSVNVNGTASEGIDEVVVYARAEGDYQIVEIDNDWNVPVDADDEFEAEDIVLSDGAGPGNNLLALPGNYRFAVVDGADANADNFDGVDERGGYAESLTTSQISQAVSTQISLRVTSGSHTANASIINGQIAVEDSIVDVSGASLGSDDVSVSFYGPRGGYDSAASINVEDDGTFDEENIQIGENPIAPTTQAAIADTSSAFDDAGDVPDTWDDISRGTVIMTVYTDGRDDTVGDGDTSDVVSAYAAILNPNNQLSRDQVTSLLASATTEDTGSDDESVALTFRYTDAQTSIENVRPAGAESGAIRPDSTMVVSGLTNRQPDENTLTIEVTEGPSVNEFNLASTEEWGTNGRWSVNLSTADVEPGMYTIEVDDGDSSDQMTFNVTAADASVSINNQTTDGSTVTVASASLSEGGFVTIHDASVLEGALFDSVRGSSDYLEAGSHSDIEVSLDTPYEEDGTAIAMPHLDTNGNEEYDFVTSEGADDAPYTANGSAVVDSATLTIATPTPTAPPTEPPTEPPTTEPPTEPPTTEPPTATPTSGQQPGFGLVVALLALVAAALIAVRRD